MYTYGETTRITHYIPVLSFSNSSKWHFINGSLSLYQQQLHQAIGNKNLHKYLHGCTEAIGGPAKLG